MQIAKHTKLRAATVLGTAAMGLALTIGPAYADHAVRWYTSAKKCNAAANAAGGSGQYYCKSEELSDGSVIYWLMGRS